MKAPEKVILHGTDGILHPGEMLLVLGPPGSGCTSLLKMLSGQTDGFRRWSGSINYSGIPLSTMQERFSSMLAFNDASDNHFPYLTVAQTLEFGASTKTPHQRINGISRKKFIETTRDILLATFGLKHAANTRVGNDFVRGVSGGERRRVSIAEMLLTRACVTCWDNPTRGLDSSTSLDFAKALRVATNLTDNVSVSALYQPGDALAEIYDKVLLLHEGRQIFFGSLADAKTAFIEMGFECTARQTIAEFLVSVTDAKARVVREGFETRVPRTAAEFEAKWKSSDEFRRLQDEITSHGQSMEKQMATEMQRFKKSLTSEKAPATRHRSPYTLNLGMQFSTTFNRAVQRIRGEYAYFLAITVTMLVIPMVIGSMFYDIDPGTSGFFSKGGVIFFMVLFNIIVTFAEVAAQFAQRPIVEKHHSYGMYHPFIDALANMLSQYPIKIFNILSFTVIVYFMAGMKREAGAFFLFVLFTYLTTLTMTAWFRITAALANTVDTALAFAGLSVLPLAVYAGYIIPRPSMHPWFKWISYINPIYYSIEALMAIEFHGRKAPCRTLVPSGPGYENVDRANQVCPVIGAKPGEAFVLGDDYLGLALDYHYSHIWRNLGISIGFFLAFTAIYAIVTEFSKLKGKSGSHTIFRKGATPAIRVSGVSDLESGPSEPTIKGEDTIPNKEVPKLAASTDVFCWNNIKYDVKIKGQTRRILDDVQGFVEPGTLTALMGASGAGKTSLLNVLAGRQGDIGVVTGDMDINGTPLDASFKRRTGYVQQQDVHMAEMTIREAFQFSALLRQPQSTPVSEKLAYVEEIISLLELDEYAEAVIGHPGESLNAEKRKRTTIGIELVARPSLLLFVDEPTSGLDSQSALSIVKLLRDLANAGQAILCTIHQPSATLLEQFDRLLLLASGGRTVYFGNLGKDCSNVIDYFAQYGAQRCPQDANPAEYVLEQIGAGAFGKASLDWPSIWATSVERQGVAERIAELRSGKESRQISDESASTDTFATTWLNQYRIVQKRLFMQHWRSPPYIAGKLFINIVGGLFLAFTFYKESNTLQGLQNKTFFIFNVLLLCLVLIVLLQPRLVGLREIYDVRERYSNMYHWSVFVASNIIVEIPFNFVIASVCFLCWYFPVGWWQNISDGRGAFMYFVFLLYQVYHTTFSQAIAVISPNAETAAMMTILFYTFILAFSGVLQPLQQLVNFWHFAYYVSPFTWLVSALMSAGVSGVRVRCAPAEINIFQPPQGTTCGEYAGTFAKMTGAAIYNLEASKDCQFCRYEVADAYLATVNMDYGDRWRNVGLLVAYICFNVCVFTLGFYLHSGPGWRGLLYRRNRK
ncbi:ABC-transporter [Aaosphaeria arxii CBS 175.79]|uniref:ABC-transporter n=1 Tax=Aaosphaeria arxii CBS 175.79 TaxID=1450172 RepID=A0A6A5YA52_9PLEO|nr:ABC-transporter [Aaosphaeria arxii CBS 175.79]KAF2021680.1 ABC-transporter [Aaosphaeria arxii CBS 175.79]